MDTITYRYNTLITPSLILLNDPPLFPRYTESAKPIFHHSHFTPVFLGHRFQISSPYIFLAAAAQYYGSLKPNKQPFNQQNGPLFYPKAFYHRRLEHPREPVGITH